MIVRLHHSIADGLALVYVLLFRPSPRPLHWWRNMLLRMFGARLHPTARVYGGSSVLPGAILLIKLLTPVNGSG